MKKTRLAERRRTRLVLYAYGSGVVDPAEIAERVALGPESVKKILRKAGVPDIAAEDLRKPTPPGRVPQGHPQRGRGMLGETYQSAYERSNR